MILQRQHEFDMMKGVAIYMVVIGHVIVFSLNIQVNTCIMACITNIHMPLFFFISGWFSRRVSATGQLFKPRLWSRFRQLMIPMCVVSSVAILRLHGADRFMENVADLWLNSFKYGYWFPMVLFEIAVLYALTVPLLNRWRGIKTQVILTLGVFVVLRLLDSKTLGTWNIYVSNFLMLEHCRDFWVCFMFGVMASDHKERFQKIVKSSGWQTAAILGCIFGIIHYNGYITVSLIPMPFASWTSSAILITMRISMAILAMGIFTPWADEAYSGKTPGKWAAMWSYMGRRSFGIYLLHYIFLFPMPGVTEMLAGMKFSFIPMLIMAAIPAAIIIAAVLVLIVILKPSRLLSWLLTGTLPSPSKQS